MSANPESDSNDIKEGLSHAYLDAMAARAGCQVQRYYPDRDGVDASVLANRNTNARIDVQIKSSSRDLWVRDRSAISFPLDARTYDLLSTDRRSMPVILVVFMLPDNDQDWLRVDPETTTLRHAAFWTFLGGAEPLNGRSTVNVLVPRSRLLDWRTLRRMVETVYECSIARERWVPDLIT